MPLRAWNKTLPLPLIGIIGITIVLIIGRIPGALCNIKLWQLGSAIFGLNKNNSERNTIPTLGLSINTIEIRICLFSYVVQVATGSDGKVERNMYKYLILRQKSDSFRDLLAEKADVE